MAKRIEVYKGNSKIDIVIYISYENLKQKIKDLFDNDCIDSFYTDGDEIMACDVYGEVHHNIFQNG